MAGLPSHDVPSELFQDYFVDGFCEEVCDLVMRRNRMQGNFTSGDEVTKVMHLDVDVLGPQSVFMSLSHLKSSRVIFKHSASDFCGGVVDVEAKLLHLCDHTHKWDRVSQCIGQAHVLTLGTGEGNLGLKLGFP